MSRLKMILAALLYLSSDKTAVVVQQVTFACALMVPVAVLVARNPSETALAGTAIGLLLLSAATALVLMSPTEGPTAKAWWAVPSLNIVACGVFRVATAPDGAVISSLVLVPALWLALRFRAQGAAVAVVLVLATITAPSLVVFEEDLSLAGVARFLVLPVTMVLLALGVLGIMQRQDAAFAQSQESLVRQREAARELARSDDRLRGVLENLNVGVLVMDAQGNDVITNHTQRELHSLVSPPDNSDPTESGHLVFRLDGSCMPPEERPAARANAGETFDNVMFRAGAPGPEQRVVSCTARFIADEEGSLDSILLMFRDVTIDTNLLRAQQDVIANVSHEMRTPLTSIVGFTDFAADSLEQLEDTQARSDVAEYLTVIRRGAEKLSALVEDLLLQQQAALGKLTLNLEPLDLSNLAQECVEGFRPLAQERGITVDLDLNAVPNVPADCQRMIQVLDNLVGNALKYTQRGGRVLVATETTAQGALLQVSDNGPGMTRDETSRIFTPFYRAVSARRSEKGGAGLGLALTKSIVDAHGGNIRVTSALGSGSTFSVLLPLANPGKDHESGERTL